MTAYYNEHDKYAAQWLRNLMKEGHITEGTVDERDIQEVRAEDLTGLRRAHFFSGIAGWELALSLAGWPRDRPVWSGSCPCQPFSAAGKRKGQEDERHLWPVFLRLIRECRPATVFGEQVASDDGYRWLARVRDDLEEAGYAVGCADLPACCAGAPHIRQRLFWVADLPGDGRGQDDRNVHRAEAGGQGRGRAAVGGEPGGLADAQRPPRRKGAGGGQTVLDGADAGRAQATGEPGVHGQTGGLGHANGQREGPLGGVPGGAGAEREGGAGGLDDPAGQRADDGRQAQQGRDGQDDGIPRQAGAGVPGGVGHASNQRQQGGEWGGDAGASRRQQLPAESGFWAHYDLVPCRDGKRRRVEPGTFPLAHGVPQRVGKLRAYGNAISPQAAALFIRAFLEAQPWR